MEGELVHIFMITYNHEPYIAQAIESVLMQKTNFKYKLLIGEDCSTDGTREIVKTYAEKYPDKIKAFLNETNLGPRNNAFQIYNACTAKYIALLEGDDYWTDHYKLQKQVDFLETNPEYGLVHSDYDILYEKSKKIIKSAHTKRIKNVFQGYCYEELLIRSFIATATVCARKKLVADFIKEHSDQLRKWKMGDRPLWLYIAKHSKIGYLNESLAVRRLLKESLSNSKDRNKVYGFLLSSYEVRLYFINKYGCSKNTKYIIKNKYNEIMLKSSFLLGQKCKADKSFKYLKKAEKNKVRRI
ncbi:MAG: glycosyltransferase, partial [Candidatus Helarchaeota archaeon]